MLHDRLGELDPQELDSALSPDQRPVNCVLLDVEQRPLSCDVSSERQLTLEDVEKLTDNRASRLPRPGARLPRL